MKTPLLISMLLVATTGIAGAGGTPQDHHCKLADGSFDATKTKKQCGAAKGAWTKDVEYKGTLTTGVVGIETSAVTLQGADKVTYELDFHGDAALTKAADGLNGKPATVSGYLTTRKGVEVAEHKIIVVAAIKTN